MTRSANTISSWLSIKSQFWHLECQCLTMRWEARYSIRRRESLLVMEGLFFVICRNWAIQSLDDIRRVYNFPNLNGIFEECA